MASPSRHSSNSTGTWANEAGSKACCSCSVAIGLAPFRSKIKTTAAPRDQMCSSRRRAARCSLVMAARRASHRAASQISTWLRLPITAAVLSSPDILPQAGGQQDAALLVPAPPRQAVLNKSPVISQLVTCSSAPRRWEMRFHFLHGQGETGTGPATPSPQSSRPSPPGTWPGSSGGLWRRWCSHTVQRTLPPPPFCGAGWGQLPTSPYFTPLIRLYCNKTGHRLQ